MKKYDIWLRSRSQKIDVCVQELAIRSNISARNKLVLTSHPTALVLRKFVDLDGLNAELETTMGSWVTRTMFAEMANELQLDDAIANTHGSKKLYSIYDVAELRENVVEALCVAYCSCNDPMVLSQSTDPLALLAKFAEVSGVSNLDFIIGKGRAEKTISAEHDMRLISNAQAIARLLCGAEQSKMTMNSSMAVLMTRYRKLAEMDTGVDGTELHLSNFDNMSLEDADYITI